MRRAGGAADPDQDETVEAARMALSQGRNLFAEGRGTQLQELLLEKYNDPVAGIIGCHLLLRALATQPDPALQAQLRPSRHQPSRPGRPGPAGRRGAVAEVRGRESTCHPAVHRAADVQPQLAADHRSQLRPARARADRVMAAGSRRRQRRTVLRLGRRQEDQSRTRRATVRMDRQVRTADTRRRRAASPRALPKAAREDARRMQVPAAATTALWREHADSR